MIKKKNKLILTLFFMSFVIATIILINNKNVKIKTSNNENKKYEKISFYSVQSKDGCDRYYENAGTRVFKQSEVEEGFPVYVVNNCATTLENYLERVNSNSKQTACNAQKDYVKSKLIASGTYVENYNKLCVDSGIDNERLTVSYNGQSCSELKDAIQKDYVGHWSDYKYYYVDHCGPYVGGNTDIETKPYYLDENNCETLKLVDSNKNMFTGILKPNETIYGATNTCGYRLFYYEGYSTSLSDYLKKVNDDKKIEACNYTKELASDGSETDRVAFNSECVGNVTGFDEQLEFKYGNNSCEQLKTIIENDYVDYWRTYVDIYKPKCMDELGFSDIKETKPYYKDASKCETLKLVDKNKNLFTGILKPNGSIYGAKNTCKYRILYYEGYATSLDDYLKKVDDEKKIEACKYIKSLAEAGNASDMDDYNKYCSGISGFSEIEKHYITFNAQDGYGIECPNNYTVPANSVCRYTFYSNKNDNSVTSLNIDLPNVTKTNKDADKNIYHGLYQIGTYYKFSYWSKDSNCKTRDIERNQTTLNINSINNEGTYYACYDETDDNTIEDITDIYPSCDAASDYQATLTNTIRVTDKYNVSVNLNDYSKNVNGTKNDKSYTINKYCNIKCTENFTYIYPSIFETVKSGTYFELIYTPQVKSTYSCKEVFYYDLWENNYNQAIENEKKAYLDYKNVELINNATDSSTSDVCKSVEKSCGEWGCSYDYYYTHKVKTTLYTYDNGTISQNNDVEATYCEYSENASNAKTKLLNSNYELYDSTKKLSYNSSNMLDRYNNVKKDRQKIEKMNNEICYHALDEKSEGKTSTGNSLNYISTNNFYDISPKINMSYDGDNDIKESNKKNVTLKSTKYYENDSGSYSDGLNNKVTDTTTFQIEYLDKKETFNAYNYGTGKTIRRIKKQNFNFDTEYDYYTDYFTGKVSENTGNIKLGNVFPISLTSLGKKNISFKIDKSGTTKAVSDILKNNENDYKCTYNVTNDVITKDKTTIYKSGDKKGYKTSFFVRPISTSSVDPNDRLNSGLLGANWTGRKGQSLINIIEAKSEGNNTYNPNNLEYSFNLTSEAVHKIRDYNKIVSYDGNGYNCNDIGGECTSNFLNELNKGIYGNGVNANLDGRNKRKYYIGGKWYYTDSLLSNKELTDVETNIKKSKGDVYGVCYSSCKTNSKVETCYDCLYRKVNGGVLP